MMRNVVDVLLFVFNTFSQFKIQDLVFVLHSGLGAWMWIDAISGCVVIIERMFSFLEKKFGILKAEIGVSNKKVKYRTIPFCLVESCVMMYLKFDSIVSKLFSIVLHEVFFLFWGRKLCRNQDNRKISSLERNLFVRKIQNKTNDKVNHYGNSVLTITSFSMKKKKIFTYFEYKVNMD